MGRGTIANARALHRSHTRQLVHVQASIGRPVHKHGGQSEGISEAIERPKHAVEGSSSMAETGRARSRTHQLFYQASYERMNRRVQNRCTKLTDKACVREATTITVGISTRALGTVLGSERCDASLLPDGAARQTYRPTLRDAQSLQLTAVRLILPTSPALGGGVRPESQAIRL